MQAESDRHAAPASAWMGNDLQVILDTMTPMRRAGRPITSALCAGFIVLLAMASPSLGDPAPAKKLTTTSTAIYPSKLCKRLESDSGLMGGPSVFFCPGVDGFKVTMWVSGDDTRMEIEKGEVSVRIEAAKISKLEWRLTNGKPFALIADVLVNMETTKKPSKVFMVRGLLNEVTFAEIPGDTKKAYEMALWRADQLVH